MGSVPQVNNVKVRPAIKASILMFPLVYLEEEYLVESQDVVASRHFYFQCRGSRGLLTLRLMTPV